MSKIFRFEDSKAYKENFRTIEIQELFSTHENVEEDITLEHVFEERNKLLSEAHQEIQSQKEAFEQQCFQKNQALDEEKQKWQQEKLELQQQAYDEGFQQGLEEGRLKAEANMAEDIKLANNTIIQSKLNAEQYLQEQEEVILEIAIRSAEKILGIALQENPERFIDIVRKGLKEAREMKEIKLYVSPLYYRLVSEHREELSEMFPIGVPFMIFVNEEIGDTDCYIETNHGRIIVSIDQQLNELRLKLGEILESVD
ncbi:flagellar assembly protein FliH [Rummeliibacillus sp. TYF005]|uniref:flagellar assembly protein FliH n=1 Tax=Rummeliibacillus sp. TYF005 TaxID=2058214 RepID=UPI000F541618|nr:flagellar assembly protein FliH [Rummeliibacillus sp. TYF005]RPJ96977.1 flagellar assembly protein FliH [Rummeliibacillus sp. TYF005]